MILLDVSPLVFRNQIFWGFVYPVQVSRVEVPEVGHKPLALQEKAYICETPPNGAFHARGGIFDETTSLSLLLILMWPFYSS